MANTSEGDKGDTPYSPNANINTDAPFTNPPDVHSAKNDSILTDIAQDLPYTNTQEVNFELNIDANADDNMHANADANMLDYMDTPEPYTIPVTHATGTDTGQTPSLPTMTTTTTTTTKTTTTTTMPPTTPMPKTTPTTILE